MLRRLLRASALAAAAFGSGIPMALLFPAYGLWWLAPVALLPVLSLLGRTTHVLVGAALGLLFGAGAGLLIGEWLYPMALVEFEVSRKVGLAAAFAVIFTAAWPMAAFGALAVALGRGQLPRWLGAALAWVAAEWLRVAGPAALPWLRLGDALFEQTLWIQPAALGGVALLTFGIVAVNGLLLEALRVRQPRPALLALAALAIWAAFGSVRLALHPLDERSLPVGLVQVATPQGERWKGDWERNLDRQLSLSEDAQAAGARLVLWSETAIDTVPSEVPDLSARLGERLEANLVTGLLLERPDGSLTNSIGGFDTEGKLVARYDKVVLVPFLEDLPGWAKEMHGLRRRLRRLAAEGSYARGVSLDPIEVAGLRLGALICYEALFPDLARETVARGADLLVNLSNDGFFPDRAAAQHSVMAVMRSVELGRPLLRVANRGVGLAVDAAGRILTRVEPDERVARLVMLDPTRIETIYSHTGHRLDDAILIVALLGSILGGRSADPQVAASRPHAGSAS